MFYPPSVISLNGDEWNSNHVVDDESFYSMSTNSTNTITHSTTAFPLTDDEEDCVSFLMTLKFRKTNVEDDVRKMKRSVKNMNQIETESNDWNSNSKCHLFSAANENGFKHEIKNSNKIEDESRPMDSFPLGLPCDSEVLSPYLSFIRSQCVEVFQASKDDCAVHSPRSRTKITEGRVGIRCTFCQKSTNKSLTSKYVSFPNHLSGIYSSVVMMQSRHFKTCTEIPTEIRGKMELLKVGGKKSKGEGFNRHDYWVKSARKLGLVDAVDGIRFRRCDSNPIEKDMDVPEIPVDTDSPSSKAIAKDDFQEKIIKKTPNQLFIPTDISSSQALQDNLCQFVNDSELFEAKDADLVPPYLFLAMAQMQPCKLQKEDRVGCYKDRSIGFKGMCCKHCGGAPGFGKYFPATVRSLAQTTTSQTIIKHVANKCTKCPDDVKKLLKKLHKEGLAQGGNYGRGGKDVNEGKPKYGSRKIFFARLWAKIQGVEVPPIPEETRKEEEMSSLGDESASANETRSMTTEEDTDDEEHWEAQRNAKSKIFGKKRRYIYL